MTQILTESAVIPAPAPLVTTSEPEHCCLAMKKFLDEGYLEHMFSFTTGELYVVVPGPKLTKTGRRHKPNAIVNYCPWCGKKQEYKK